MSRTSALAEELKGREAFAVERVPEDSWYALRIDGRAFSKFTRGMGRPCDEHMLAAMSATTEALMRRLPAAIGYTQSDEISLVFPPWSDRLFGRRAEKLVSVAAGLASAAFALEAVKHWPEHTVRSLPHFDARAVVLAEEDQVIDYLCWRAEDAERNAINGIAHHTFGPARIHGVGISQRRSMLDEAGVDLNTYPSHFLRGAFFCNERHAVELDAETLARIPEAHRPVGPVLRNFVVRKDWMAGGEAGLRAELEEHMDYLAVIAPES